RLADKSSQPFGQKCDVVLEGFWQSVVREGCIERGLIEANHIAAAVGPGGVGGVQRVGENHRNHIALALGLDGREFCREPSQGGRRWCSVRYRGARARVYLGDEEVPHLGE